MCSDRPKISSFSSLDLDNNQANILITLTTQQEEFPSVGLTDALQSQLTETGTMFGLEVLEITRNGECWCFRLQLYSTNITTYTKNALCYHYSHSFPDNCIGTHCHHTLAIYIGHTCLVIHPLTNLVYHFSLADGCPQDNSNQLYRWPESELGIGITLSCSCGQLNTSEINRQAVRVCGGSYSQGVEWRQANTTLCAFDTNAQSLCDATLVSCMLLLWYEI